MSLAAPPAFAVHDLDLVELDENVDDNDGAPDYDWVNVYCDVQDPTRAIRECSTGGPSGPFTGTPCDVTPDCGGGETCEDVPNLSFPECTGVLASPASVESWEIDPVNSSLDDIMAGGKDSINPVCTAADPNACGKEGQPGWEWKRQSSNDKNDIEHSMAVIDEDEGTGDKILYVATDRLANNGSASITVWVYQERVSQVECGDFPCPFSIGHDGPGDFALQTDFTSGGDVGRLQAYIWDDGNDGFCNDPGGCGDPTTDPDFIDTEDVQKSHGDLERITDVDFVVGDPPIVDCDTAGAGDNLCAQVNTGNESVPWDYDYKFSGGVAPSSTFFPATFFEVGINLTTLFGENIPCFSSLGVYTRQSGSETAELEDKHLIAFETCVVEADTAVFLDDDPDPGDPDTQIYPPAGGVVFVGDPIYDVATITGVNFVGDAPDPGDPAANPSPGVFKLWRSNNCTGTQVTTGVTGWDSVALAVGTPDDEIATATTPVYTIVAADIGAMSISFSWDGDDNYPAGAVVDSTNQKCETFEVQQPFLTITKDIVNECSTELGTFNVFTNDGGGNVNRGTLGDGGTTGAIGLVPNTYTVSEAGAASTDLSDYLPFISGIAADCNQGGVRQASSGSVTLAGNDSKQCDFTNVRKPTVTINKDLIGVDFYDLLVNSVVPKSGQNPTNATWISGSGEDVDGTGTVTVRIDGPFAGGVFGPVTVGETHSDGSAIVFPTDGVHVSIICDDANVTNAQGAASATILTLRPGENVTCTIKNEEIGVPDCPVPPS
jgi:hypothetical protein